MPRADPRAVFRAGVSRPRRSLALPVGLLRGHGARRPAPARGLGPLPGLAGPQGRPVPAPSGGVNRVVPRRLQHERAGLRRRTALSCPCSRFGRSSSGGGSRRSGSGSPTALAFGSSPWPLCVFQGFGVFMIHPFEPELLQRPGRRPPGCRAARDGIDLLGDDAVDPVPARPSGRSAPAGRVGRDGTDPDRGRGR